MIVSSQDIVAENLEYDPLDQAVQQEPYPYYKLLRANEPVKWLPSLQAFCVATYDEIDILLKDGITFSSAQFWPELLGEYDPVPEELPMISIDPPNHVKLRKLANKAFVPSQIGKLKERTYQIANEFVPRQHQWHRFEVVI